MQVNKATILLFPGAIGAFLPISTKTDRKPAKGACCKTPKIYDRIRRGDYCKLTYVCSRQALYFWIRCAERHARGRSTTAPTSAGCRQMHSFRTCCKMMQQVLAHYSSDFFLLRNRNAAPPPAAMTATIPTTTQIRFWGSSVWGSTIGGSSPPSAGASS